MIGVTENWIVLEPKNTLNEMKTKLFLTLVVLVTSSVLATAQEEISTIFRGNGLRSSGGYGAIVNKFTTIDGKFANMVEVYGGWYINHRLLLGVGAGATTNYIGVPDQYSTLPNERMSYEMGQVGMVTEFVIASNKAVHATFNVMTGAGFTLQYVRYPWHEVENYEFFDYDHDSNWFFLVEPGINVELNLLKWMRFTPGVSYRIANGSQSQGLTDKKISGGSINLGFKFGKF